MCVQVPWRELGWGGGDEGTPRHCDLMGHALGTEAYLGWYQVP